MFNVKPSGSDATTMSTPSTPGLRSFRNAPLTALCVCLASTGVFALDKQGSAHGGNVEGDDNGFGVSGALMLGAAVYNPSYAARPDNTGLTLLRYGAHFDIDLLGRLLSIPIDVNFFTDRERAGIALIAPTEFDIIAGITSTLDTGPGAVELGIRVEHDRPVDTGTFTQTYVDARARYLYSFAALFPKLATALRQGDISGWVTLGVFAFNPTYAARPDNTGLALFRYSAHSELSTFDDLLSFGLDATLFTDRQSAVVVAPSEIDFTAEIILHKWDFELHLAYERDMPIDKPGLVQQFAYVLAVWSFDFKNLRPKPFSHRNVPVSP